MQAEQESYKDSINDLQGVRHRPGQGWMTAPLTISPSPPPV